MIDGGTFWLAPEPALATATDIPVTAVPVEPLLTAPKPAL